MGELRPRLDDVRYSQDLLSSANTAVVLLSDEAFRALMALVNFSASSMVWTYSAPTDGSIPDDDGMLARITQQGLRRWKRVRPELEQFFVIRRGHWRLKEEWIEIDGRPMRPAIPAAMKAEVLSREGRRCTYCGDTDGPFAFDHIFPVSKGGQNDPSNLTVACRTCNSSKGGRTLAEWMAWRTGPTLALVESA